MKEKDQIPLLQVNNLGLSFVNKKSTQEKVVLKDLSFRLYKGEVLGIVGESGVGKSITALTIMGLANDLGAKIYSGEVIYSPDGITQQSILSLDKKEINFLRRKHISMIFQEPLMSVNENMKCGKQLMEILSLNDKRNYREKKKTIIDYLEKVGITEVDRIYDSYPFEISGGQLQRVIIVMAICNRPHLIIADEPTTSLDVLVQKTILNLLIEIKNELDISILYISHDISVIQSIADRIIVLNEDGVVERGNVHDIIHHPKMEYTQTLIKHYNTVNTAVNTEIDVSQNNKNPLLVVKGVTKTYIQKRYWSQLPKSIKVGIKDISFELYKGEILGLAGESGSGKSTLAKVITQLIKLDEGEILFEGISLTDTKENINELRRKIQIVFQDPYSSLNPRMTVGKMIKDVLSAHHKFTSQVLKEKANQLLSQTGLPESFMDRYPHQLSGGQRQRVAIARALAINPEILICDEPVSALDVSIRDQMIQLLLKLNKTIGLTILFISHDLSLIRKIAERLIILKDGNIVESGFTENIFQSPKSQYTKDLLDAIPLI